MDQSAFAGRLTFHDSIETMEVDFSNYLFADPAMVDAFYDHIDQRVAATGKRWYFLVLYEGCEIAPEAWERFAARGKHANITYGLGTVRVHPSERTREAIRTRAERETFRANIFDTRDQAMVALGEMRKRRELIGASVSDAYLRVQDIHLSFGGVKALAGVGFQVHRGEITSIIGPNGAGKTSMINVISGFYRPDRGRIFFEGADRTHLPAHKVARLGFARTFQNIALFKGMSVLDNIMTGRLLKMERGLFWQALWWGPAQKEESEHRAFCEKVIDFLEIEPKVWAEANQLRQRFGITNLDKDIDRLSLRPHLQLATFAHRLDRDFAHFDALPQRVRYLRNAPALCAVFVPIDVAAA